MFQLCLRFIHLLILAPGGGLLQMEGAGPPLPLSDLSGSQALLMANGVERYGAAQVTAVKCCHNSLPWSNELHLPPVCVGGM